MKLTRSALALFPGVSAGLAAGLMLPVILAGTATAQTLPDALAQAYASNPTLQTARAQLRAVDENVPQALAGWRPTVSINSTAGVLDGHTRQRTSGGFISSSDASREIYQNSVTVTQPIFRGGRTVAGTRRAENQVLAQRARLLATEQQVMGDTVSAYVNVIRDQELLRLNINNEQVLTEQLRATNERFRVGEITRTDVAQAESRVAGARANRANAEGNLQISRATFQQRVGAPPQRLTAPQPLRLPVATALEAGQLAAVNNPTVVATLFDEAGARDNIDLQIATLLPTVSISGQAARNDNSGQAGIRQTFSQVTANLTVPIYQGGGEHSAVRQARQTAQQARGLVDEQRRTVTQAATQAWEQLQSSKTQVESVRAAIRASEIALDGVQREAIVGSRTTLDVLNAEQELLQNRTNLVQALATVVTQSYNLASTIGRLTAADLGLAVDQYDQRAYYNAVRNRWAGIGDYAGAASDRR